MFAWHNGSSSSIDSDICSIIMMRDYLDKFISAIVIVFFNLVHTGVNIPFDLVDDVRGDKS